MNNLTLLGLLLLLLMVLAGYLRGLFRILVALTALLVSSLVAVPLSFTTRWAVDGIGMIPLTFKPLAAAVLTGVLFFIILQSAGEYFLHRREKKLKEEGNPPMTKWERIGGAVFGILWGFVFYAFILTGIDVIASVDETMSRAAAATKDLAAVRQKLENRQPDGRKGGITAQSGSGSGGHSASQPPEPSPEESADSSSSFLQSQIREPLANFRAQLKSSIYAPLVKKFNPVNEKASRTMEKLMVVVRDQSCYEKFQSHPVVTELSKNPRLQELANDPEIRKIIQEKRYGDLLNNPKVAALLNDRQVLKDFRSVDIEKVLDEVTIEKGAQGKPTDKRTQADPEEKGAMEKTVQ